MALTVIISMVLVVNFTEDAEDAGVVKFKKGYNAEIIEYVGDFIKPINKPVYAAYTALKKVKDRIF